MTNKGTMMRLNDCQAFGKKHGIPWSPSKLPNIWRNNLRNIFPFILSLQQTHTYIYVYICNFVYLFFDLFLPLCFSQPYKNMGFSKRKSTSKKIVIGGTRLAGNTVINSSRHEQIDMEQKSHDQLYKSRISMNQAQQSLSNRISQLDN